MRMSMTSRTSSLAGGVLIEVLSSGNCGTGREYNPAVVLIPRFYPVTQEVIAYRSSLSGFKRSHSSLPDYIREVWFSFRENRQQGRSFRFLPTVIPLLGFS